MKAYGSEHEEGDAREWPDAGDIRDLGLSSKHGKTRSKTRRLARRFYKKMARAASRALCRKEQGEL